MKQATATIFMCRLIFIHFPHKLFQFARTYVNSLERLF
jgi:hypothetical protein